MKGHAWYVTPSFLPSISLPVFSFYFSFSFSYSPPMFLSLLCLFVLRFLFVLYTNCCFHPILIFPPFVLCPPSFCFVFPLFNLSFFHHTLLFHFLCTVAFSSFPPLYVSMDCHVFMMHYVSLGVSFIFLSVPGDISFSPRPPLLFSLVLFYRPSMLFILLLLCLFL